MVVGQFGQSIDARIATPTGHSHYINGAAGLAHLHRLRALVDAVVVGIGTAVADDRRPGSSTWPCLPRVGNWRRKPYWRRWQSAAFTTS